MKKKFSLGDIIRKMNEEQPASSAAQENQKTEPHLNSPQKEASTQPYVQVEKNPGNTESELLQQPVFGSRKTASHIRNVDVFTSEVVVSGDSKTEDIIKSDKEPPKAVCKEPTKEEPKSTIETEKPFASYTAEQKLKNTPDRMEKYFEDDDEEDEEEFNVFRYLGIILRRKNVVLLLIITMTVFSIFKYLTSVKTYTANARLLFKPHSEEIVQDVQAFRFSGDYEKAFSTHLELLKSYTVLNLVAQNLNNKLAVQQIAEALIIKRGETNGQKNEIIELSYKNSNAEIARDVLNELCRTYIDYRRDVNSQEITRLIYKFEVQINKLQSELDQKESNLRKFKEENRVVQLSNETNLTVTKIADMELALQQTNLRLVEIEEKTAALTSQISKQEQDIVQSITFSDPFQSKLSALELELNSLASEYSPEHYKVKMLKQQIENLKLAAADSLSREAASKTLVKNPIRQSLVQDFVNLTIEKSALIEKRTAQQKIIEQLNTELLKLPSMEQKFAYLERETESILQTLRMLKTKYEEAKINRDSQESDLKLLEMAQTPSRAVSKVGLTSILIGILMGFVLGCALAFLLEYLDQSLKEPRDVERVMELPLLGIVPLIETSQGLIEQTTDLTKTVLEPFRALRANLKHIATQHNLKTFIVCSAVKGEGKTTLSANMAITFSLEGKKIILIDADLRRSQLHTLFNIPKETGLSDYLLGMKTIDEIIKPTKYPNLFIVTSGERPDNPAELLGTYRFDLLLDEIRSKGDIILFDSPALLPVSDSITMAPKMDCCVMVVRTFWTPLKAAKQAKNQLRRVGTKIFGGILNGVSHSKGYYPYYYGYYGYYGYKYSYEDDKEQRMSIRAFGLKIENTLKETAKNVFFKLPILISVCSKMARDILGRKMFWFLLISFVGLAAVLMWREQAPALSNETIRYLGIGTAQDNTSSKTLLMNDMAVPSSTHKTTDDSVKTDLFEKVDMIESGLEDSITLWAKAFSEKNTLRYLSFYSTLSFKSTSGNFKKYSTRVKQKFSEEKNTTMEIDSVNQGKRGATYSETNIYLKARSSSSLRTVECNLVWQLQHDGWKIVEEKEIAQESVNE